jgi:hypothetical protein
MTTTTTNGRTRKSLAEQIDRLDAILDGLADALNEAVADAVKDAVTAAVQEAVHAAVIEVLTNAELRKRLGVTQVPASQPSAPVVVCLAGAARRCWNWLTDAWHAAKAAARLAGSKAMEAASRCLVAGQAKLQEVREEVKSKARAGWMLTIAIAALARRFRKQLLVALGVGVLVGVVFYFGGREVASVGCGLAGFAGSLATGAVNRLRRMLPFVVASGSRRFRPVFRSLAGQPGVESVMRPAARGGQPEREWWGMGAKRANADCVAS